MFTSEEELVLETLPILQEHYSLEKEIVREPNGLFGIPDVMIYDKYVISIEFKLKNWKRAMFQAYRYKGFSSKSYVILDEHFSKKAIESIDEFIHFNIGLCTVENNKMTCHYEPHVEKPYSPNLAEKALEYFG